MKLKSILFFTIYTAFVVLVSVIGLTIYNQKDKKELTQSVKWVIDHPEYADKLFAINQSYIKTAEKSMQVELDSLVVLEPTATPTYENSDIKNL